MKFRQWMSELNAIVWSVAQVDVLDLPDYSYREAFDDERTPQEVAYEVLEENGFDLKGYEL